MWVASSSSVCEYTCAEVGWMALVCKDRANLLFVLIREFLNTKHIKRIIFEYFRTNFEFRSPSLGQMREIINILEGKKTNNASTFLFIEPASLLRCLEPKGSKIFSFDLLVPNLQLADANYATYEREWKSFMTSTRGAVASRKQSC